MDDGKGKMSYLSVFLFIWSLNMWNLCWL